MTTILDRAIDRRDREREARRRRNPILALPAAARLDELPPEAKAALRAVLLDLADQANAEAERSWSKRKGPMAAYWRSVSTYAKHLARATARARELPSRDYPEPGSLAYGERLVRAGAAGDPIPSWHEDLDR